MLRRARQGMRHTGHIHVALIDERDVIGLRRLIASEAKSEPRVALSNASQARAISTRPRMAEWREGCLYL